MVKVILFLVFVATATALTRKFLGRSLPTRIVGGEDANRHEFPFMASLHFFGSHICGASLIWTNRLLTSAHCFGPPEAFTVKAGKHNINVAEANQQIREIESITIHPGYPGDESGSGMSNDIAILKTKTPFVFNSGVLPIPLPLSGRVTKGVATIIGWGTTNEEGSYSNVLQKAQVQIVTDAECRQAYGESIIEDNMICAGLPQGGVDACVGDSGGPLTSRDIGWRYLAGVTSFGFGCGRPGYPGVFTEVSMHRDWINSNL